MRALGRHYPIEDVVVGCLGLRACCRSIRLVPIALSGTAAVIIASVSFFVSSIGFAFRRRPSGAPVRRVDFSVVGVRSLHFLGSYRPSVR